MRFVLILIVLCVTVSLSHAQVYELKNDVIDDGGTKMTSSGYILRGSFGQSTIGKISSAKYIAYIGFWHPYPVGPGIEEDFFFPRSIPIVFSLSQNYPNPVTRSTTIKYGLPTETRVDIRVFNSAGQQVRTLVSESQEPGYYKVNWDLRGVSGELLPNGVYFYRIGTGDFIRTRKMVILR
ncbi:MAG: T9SS type A sorting domain-containing protein [bacterium]